MFFASIFNPEGVFGAEGVTVGTLFLAWGISLFCGVLVAVSYCIKNKSFSKNLLISVVVFPIITQSVVMLVSRGGNEAMIGVGVAIAGVFGLVRFRSIQGNAREISYVFLAMAIGVAAGVGQVWFALTFTGIVCALFVAFKFIPIKSNKESEIKITVPEDVEFETEFDKILKSHTSSMKLISVKSTKMGSLFEVRYRLMLKNQSGRKALIDELRVVNGNLPITYHDVIEEDTADKL